MSWGYSSVRLHKVLKVYLYLGETGALMGAVISSVSRELNYSNRFIGITPSSRSLFTCHIYPHAILKHISTWIRRFHIDIHTWGNNTTMQMSAKPTVEEHKVTQTHWHKPPRMCKQTHKKCEHKWCWFSFHRARVH